MMHIHDAIAQGTHGATVAIPTHFELQKDEPFVALMLDHELGITWHIMWAPHLHMDLRATHRAHLESRIARHAHHMFEHVHAEIGSDDPPRTSDASWFPMIALTYHTLHATTVLETLHRMAYEPGLEIIMGHLLVPLEGGLLELRAQARETGATGVRESLVLGLQQAPVHFPPQSAYDTPELDATCPDHVLSRTRRALHDMLPRITSITSPASWPDDETFTSPAPACTLTLPPRFHPDDAGRLQRTSFCITDGLEHLILHRSDARATPDRLAELASEHLRSMYEAKGVRDVDVSTGEVDSSMISAVVRGEGKKGALRHVFVWWLDHTSRMWEMGMLGDPRSPDEELIDELATSARTLVPTRRKKFLGVF